MVQKSVRVIAGTGNFRLRQVSVTGASGFGNFPQWTQVTAAQAAAGPTGWYETVQAMNTGPSGGQENKTVQIVGYVGPA
jgi:hypothetical protein